jgi:hypothetical protein
MDANHNKLFRGTLLSPQKSLWYPFIYKRMKLMRFYFTLSRKPIFASMRMALGFSADHFRTASMKNPADHFCSC